MMGLANVSALELPSNIEDVERFPLLTDQKKVCDDSAQHTARDLCSPPNATTSSVWQKLRVKCRGTKASTSYAVLEDVHNPASNNSINSEERGATNHLEAEWQETISTLRRAKTVTSVDDAFDKIENMVKSSLPELSHKAPGSSMKTQKSDFDIRSWRRDVPNQAYIHPAPSTLNSPLYSDFDSSPSLMDEDPIARPATPPPNPRGRSLKRTHSIRPGSRRERDYTFDDSDPFADPITLVPDVQSLSGDKKTPKSAQPAFWARDTDLDAQSVSDHSDQETICLSDSDSDAYEFDYAAVKEALQHEKSRMFNKHATKVPSHLNPYRAHLWGISQDANEDENGEGERVKKPRRRRFAKKHYLGMLSSAIVRESEMRQRYGYDYENALPSYEKNIFAVVPDYIMDLTSVDLTIIDLTPEFYLPD